jgi:hypothetical protein
MKAVETRLKVPEFVLKELRKSCLTVVRQLIRCLSPGSNLWNTNQDLCRLRQLYRRWDVKNVKKTLNIFVTTNSQTGVNCEPFNTVIIGAKIL